MPARNEKILRGQIVIVGLGNWGVSLAHGLRTAGVEPSEMILRSQATSRRQRLGAGLQGIPIHGFGDARLDGEIFWLCVPDSAIAAVTRQIVKRLRERSTRAKSDALAGRIFIHSSGVFSTSVLRAAAESGASVAAVHPLMTFPSRKPVSLKGIPFAVETADGGLRRRLNSLVRRLGGEPFAIGSAGKALYHAAAVMASPLLASLLAATEDVAALAGLDSRQSRRLFAPIAKATLENLYTRGKGNSLSGPIARGDGTAIRLHLQALAAHPMLAEIYRSLALYASFAFPVHDPRAVRRMLMNPGRESAVCITSTSRGRVRD